MKGYTMAIEFAKVLKKLRTEKGLSQRELADDMYVTRSTIARWENGSRLPDITMISRLSRCLGADINILLNAVSENDGAVNVIILDDIKITLNGELSVIKNVLPNATVTGFTSPSEAIEYASTHSVALAFLDIELGKSNGLNICNELLNINPHTDVVYVTAYSNYSLDAWSTGAFGFLLKPITTDDVKRQLKKMRYPYNLGDTV